MFPATGDTAWKDTLTKEKVQLARDMSFIDRRLAEIEVELSSMGNTWNDSLQERVINPAQPPAKFTIVGKYSNEYFDALVAKSNINVWYDDKFANGYLPLLLTDVHVWPVEEHIHTSTLEVHESHAWKSAQAFEFDDTELLRMASIDKQFNQSHLEDMVLIQYPRANYIGFLVRKQDIQFVKLP